MRGTALGLLIATVTSLNVTIAIVLKLGDSIAGVAEGFVDTDVSALSRFGSDLALPVMEDASAVGENIRMFKVIVSILILFQVAAVSTISNRLRGGGRTAALGQSIQLLWVAGITSFMTSVVLEGASGIFGV
jgi:hypothetical protein